MMGVASSLISGVFGRSENSYVNKKYMEQNFIFVNLNHVLKCQWDYDPLRSGLGILNNSTKTQSVFAHSLPWQQKYYTKVMLYPENLCNSIPYKFL